MLEHQIGLKQLAVAQIFIFSRTPSHTSNKSIKLTYTPTGKIEKIEDILVVFAELIIFFLSKSSGCWAENSKGVAWVNTGSRIWTTRSCYKAIILLGYKSTICDPTKTCYKVIIVWAGWIFTHKEPLRMICGFSSSSFKHRPGCSIWC